MHRIFLLSILCLAGTVAAQGERLDLQDDVPIDTYLALLAQVAPPARDGAEAYMAAFRSRCGRALRTVELRRAFAQGSGDPVLMNMVRASHERDTAALQRLGASIACPAKCHAQVPTPCAPPGTGVLGGRGAFRQPRHDRPDLSGRGEESP